MKPELLTRWRWLAIASAFVMSRGRAAAQALTPPHPRHGVLIDNLECNPVDAGKYLQCTAGGAVIPAPGVPFPVWVYNVSLAPATGGLRLTRDPVTGVLTLPSAPQPPEALDLVVNGLTQTIGADCTVNGTQVTPGADQVIGGKVVSPKAIFLGATMIRASYPR
jgi:hypothetical protein